MIIVFIELIIVFNVIIFSKTNSKTSNSIYRNNHSNDNSSDSILS